MQIAKQSLGQSLAMVGVFRYDVLAIIAVLLECLPD
jgi:hypothetical protein